MCEAIERKYCAQAATRECGREGKAEGGEKRYFSRKKEGFSEKTKRRGKIEGE